MNIKDFLIDNYIWIIVVLIITIITIIGFLADKSNKNKQKKEQNNQQSQVPNINQEQQNTNQIQYQESLSSAEQQVNLNSEMNSHTNINQNAEIIPNVENKQDMNNINQEVNSGVTVSTNVNPTIKPISTNNVVENTLSETTYTPLSEQKPNVKPQPVPNYSNVSTFNQQANQINNNGLENYQTTTALNNNQMNVIPQTQQSLQTQGITSTIPVAPPINNNYGMNMQTQMPSQNNMTQQINPNTIPQPVNPQPIIQNQQQFYNSMPMQQQMQPMTNQQNTNTQSTTPQPINFVFGPQPPSNNQNM